MRALLLITLTTAVAAAQTREQKLIDDREKFNAETAWIYNDPARGFAEATRTGKPMLVVFRCVPCVECVKLDDDLVNADPRVKPLLEKFVCVRVVSTNGLDLATFQFDYDQSFAAMMLNADGTIYGRYGTRSHRTAWSDDVSIEGLAEALEGALALHEGYPRNKADLAGKRGPVPEFGLPEQYPMLKGKYPERLAQGNEAFKSCIHCHQIGDAIRALHRKPDAAMPEEVLFQYPHPRIIGLQLDPKKRATVLGVRKDSEAAKAGLRAGDRIRKLGGQPILSIADVQWVLHGLAANGATVRAEVARGDAVESLTLSLPKGWRQRDDLSWRTSTWWLRRMALGGMKLEPLTSAERQHAALPEDGLALRVVYLGATGPHGAAKRAGAQKADVIVAFDGRSDFSRETDLIAHGLLARRIGDKVPVTLLRDGQRREIVLPMQP